MDDEKIIRDEAQSFSKRQLSFRGRDQPVDNLKKIKSRLQDFYSSQSKSIFLDEVKKYTLDKLQDHRNQAHGGKPDPECGWENNVEKLLFYVKQEVEILPVVAHQKNPSDFEKNRNKVFISYSHIDKDYLIDIKRHFKPFLKHIDFWDDSKIEPGQKWKEEIKTAITKTKVAILLVSTDFLGSDFIATDELPPLLEAAEKEGAVILIVILRPCLFDEFPELNQFQAMNAPSIPVSKMDMNEREELYVNLVRQTKRILKEK